MTRDEWEVFVAERTEAQENAMDHMTDSQLSAIQEVLIALGGALDMLDECNDLYLSDINKMESSYYKLKSAFNKE